MNYDKDWYESLIKPKFQPPAWVFTPVWLFLYTIMTISFILILVAPFKLTNIFAYIFFIVQIFLNVQWGYVFFKEHNLRKSFLHCIKLTFVVFLTMLSFFHINVFAGIFFLIYFLWCCFATILMFEILELNEW